MLNKIPSYSLLFLVVLCIAVGCPNKKDDLPLKTTTDYGKEAAKRVEESGGCEYAESGYTNSDDGFSFKYPKNWSIKEYLQTDTRPVAVAPNYEIGGTIPFFGVEIDEVDPGMFNAVSFSDLKLSHKLSHESSFVSNIQILAFEHGKLDDRDAVFVRFKADSFDIEKVECFVYLFNNRNKCYTLVFSGPRDNEQVQREMDAILATFKIGQ